MALLYDRAVTTFRFGSPMARRAVRDGLVVAGLVVFAYLLLVVAPAAGTFGFDAFAYWAVDPADPYRELVGGLGAFTYSPAIARLFAPFGMLPWTAFLVLWTGLLVGTVIWLGGRRALWILAFPPVALELYHGNVHLLLAAMIVLGFRWPGVWAFGVLTKVTPVVGLVWFAVRREWRSLGIALAVTAAITAVSWVVDAAQWQAWLGLLGTASMPDGQVAQAQVPIPLWIRLPAAAAIVAWGGLTDRRWTVPVGVTLALPVLWPSGFAVLAACLPLATRPAAAGAVPAAAPASVRAPERAP